MNGRIAEVVAIGDELTSGERLDTNSQWLSRELTAQGWEVLFHTSVGDDLPALIQALRTTVGRADVVLVTGGLGPTADDLTRQALADLCHQPLELRGEVLEHIRALFAQRSRPMPPANEVQAMFPRGCRVIPNPHGTAPGLDIEIARQAQSAVRVFALPGVPAEMQQMWKETVAPTLASIRGSSQRTIRHHEMKCFGVGESDLEQMLPDLIRRGRKPRVGITVSRATITLRITAEGVDSEHCRHIMQPTIETIRQCLGSLVYAEDDQELQDVVVRQLAQCGMTLAVVEAFTGGLLGHWLSQADPFHTVFRGSIIRCAEAAMADPDFCMMQAEAARREFDVDLAIVVGAAREQIPRAPLILSHSAHREVKELILQGHPDIILARSAKQALDMARRWLLKRATDEGDESGG